MACILTTRSESVWKDITSHPQTAFVAPAFELQSTIFPSSKSEIVQLWKTKAAQQVHIIKFSLL